MEPSEAIVVEGALTIDAIGGAAERIERAVAQAKQGGRAVTINVSKVSDFDLSAIQLFYSVVTASETNKVPLTVVWGNFGERLNQMCRFAGFKPVAEIL